MVVARLAILLGAFGTLAHGLKFSQEGGAARAVASELEGEAFESTAGEAPSREAQGSQKRKRRLGAIGASAQWVKARHESGKTGKAVVDFYLQAQLNHNLSMQHARHKEKMLAKADEIVALKNERRQMAGKHTIYNKTLAQERKKKGDTNKTGLWIITEEPETKDDRHRRKFQRDLRKQFPMAENATHFLEAAKQDAEMEETYAVREQWALEQAKAVHKDFQAAQRQRKESAQVLQNSVAAARGKMAAATGKMAAKLRPKQSKASGAKESAKADSEE